MLEYEMLQARARELQAGADRDRLVREALRIRRTEAKAARRLRRETRQSRHGAGGLSGDRRSSVWGIANLHLHLR